MKKYASRLTALLAHPLTQDMDIDDPDVTHLRRQIILQNSFLKQLYLEWYHRIDQALDKPETQRVLELGSGAGFITDVMPDTITSEILPGTEVKILLDGQHLPFRGEAFTGIVLVNVLHHIAQPMLFLMEAARCVQPGGKIVMIEPWVTAWSRLIYAHLHHEPFCPATKNWDLESGGPLSTANGAMPWIIFHRDRHRFERVCPQWRINSIDLMMPFSYIVSGGVSMRQLLPGWSFPLCRNLESLLSPWNEHLAMFSLICLSRST